MNSVTSDEEPGDCLHSAWAKQVLKTRAKQPFSKLCPVSKCHCNDFSVGSQENMSLRKTSFQALFILFCIVSPAVHSIAINVNR